MRDQLCERAGIEARPGESGLGLLRRLRSSGATLGGLRFEEGPSEDALFARVVLGDGPSLPWTAAAAGLEHLGEHEGRTFYVDALEDEGGAHRVYWIRSDGWVERIARDVEDLLDALGDARLPEGDEAEDAWAKHPRSAERALPLLDKLSPAPIYAASLRRDRVWRPPPVEWSGKGPGWHRGAMVYTLARFRRRWEVATPPGVPEEELLPIHRTLLRRLEEIRVANELADVPTIVGELALLDDDRIAELAQRWMQRFDDVWHPNANVPAVEEKPGKPKGPTAPEVRKVLARAIEHLVASELLELEGQKDELATELATAFFESLDKRRSKKAMLESLIEVLLESDEVADVFGDDETLAAALAAALAS